MDMAGRFGGIGNSLSGALDGLVGGLAKSGIVNKDDPGLKVFNAQQELASLQAQEAEVLAEVGRKVMDTDAASAYPAEADKLRLIRANMAEAQGALNAAEAEQNAQEAAAQQAELASTCPSCGAINPEGINFCQECGTKLGAPAKVFCTSCGAENAQGTKFCGACGAQM
jgi:ribosomal protein L40E